MDQNYKPIHQQADKLVYKFQDIVDDPNHSDAQSMRREIKEVVEDIEVNKAPRAVEDRIRQVQKHLDKIKANGKGSFMTPDDADVLFDGLEQIRNQLRRLPNY